MQLVTEPILDLHSIWLGTPAVWVGPSGTKFDTRYFAVRGLTQPGLIASINNARLCDTYHCLADPAVPSTGAWALEGTDPVAPIYCYSPATASFIFHEYILLPQWNPARGTVARQLVERWNALMEVLFVHEAMHAEIAIRDHANLQDQAHHLSGCAAFVSFWADPHVYDQLNADQNAFHAQLRADCRPEVGCIPPNWLGWS